MSLYTTQTSLPQVPKKSNRLTLFASGFIAGAVTAFLLDPSRGKLRRALLRDRFSALQNQANRKGSRWSRDFKNRAEGLISELRRPMSPHVDDVTLERRVRSEFGRIIRHTKAIRTSVTNGVVTLTGAILADEVENLIKRVKSVAGVQDVVNKLDVYQTSIGVSELQGSGPEYLQ